MAQTTLFQSLFSFLPLLLLPLLFLEMIGGICEGEREDLVFFLLTLLLFTTLCFQYFQCLFLRCKLKKCACACVPTWKVVKRGEKFACAVVVHFLINRTDQTDRAD